MTSHSNVIEYQNFGQPCCLLHPEDWDSMKR